MGTAGWMDCRTLGRRCLRCGIYAIFGFDGKFGYGGNLDGGQRETGGYCCYCCSEMEMGMSFDARCDDLGIVGIAVGDYCCTLGSNYVD